MRYREDFEPVLKGVNLQIAPGSSVGIVGRTGSGKSSLFRGEIQYNTLLAILKIAPSFYSNNFSHSIYLLCLSDSGLLRLTELEGGVIAIDGVDVSALGLNALRYSNSDKVSFTSIQPILPYPAQSVLP
jgi:energy-coupling factor transporter ATP-binding protein EcfA2